MPSDAVDGKGQKSFLLTFSAGPKRMQSALERMGVPRNVASQQVLVDKRKGPKLQPGVPIAAGYADNGNFIRRGPRGDGGRSCIIFMKKSTPVD